MVHCKIYFIFINFPHTFLDTIFLKQAFSLSVVQQEYNRLQGKILRTLLWKILEVLLSSATPV